MNNKNVYSWNPVYNFVIKLKNEYQKNLELLRITIMTFLV